MIRPQDAPLARRTVAVLGEQQGSGTLFTPSTVLTCAHVIGSAHTARVALPGTNEQVPCQVVWSDTRLDAALLHAPIRHLASFKEMLVRASSVTTALPIPNCLIVGFPEIQRYDGRKLDVDQFSGTVLPLASLIRRTMVFEFDRPPATERADGSSPLAGLSGAPVYAGETLLAIVRGVPSGRGHRRVECVPIDLMLCHPGFRDWFDRPGAPGRLPPLEQLTHIHPQDPHYEEEYAEALGAEYRKTRIFGLNELSKRDCEWDLNTAYLSLEAMPRERPHRPDASTTAHPAPYPAGHSSPHSAAHPSLPSAVHSESACRRIEALLPSRPRVLLRGDAGAGKTTLLWWLAAQASAGTLDSRLAELNGLVPFVVPLRTLRARGASYPGLDELPGASRLVIDRAPEGWAGRVLGSGRALLLVDGLDEVPYDDREEAHRWLSSLLRRYPRTRCVATVRPLAVPPDWLESEGFEELSLLPMREGDIQAFIAAWYAAARLDDDDHETLRERQRDLVQQFALSPALRDLARTPLLCAVICALHRRREGLLPETRWALYRSALEMLLGERDQHCRVNRPEGITLTVEEHKQLLQRIAIWLVRGGQSEFTREQALYQLTRALTGMPQIREQGEPEQILSHLLNRSGLLQERTKDVFQFAHRTFQDFLAAKEFIEGDELNELLQHATEQQWHDVLLLSAGHCSRREMSVLVSGLLGAGHSVRGHEHHCTTLYVLAALCAQHAAWMEDHVHRRVRGAIASVLPPRTATELHILARLGPSVLPLLPSADELLDPELKQTAALICAIGGEAAIPYARRLAGATHRSAQLADSFARSWAAFPTEEYADGVLRGLDLSRSSLVITRQDQLNRLGLLPHARRIEIAGDFTPTALTAGLAGHPPADPGPLPDPGTGTGTGTGRRLSHLSLAHNRHLTDLSLLPALGAPLTSLLIQGCPALEDLTALTGLGELEVLTLIRLRLSSADLRILAEIPRLRRLTVVHPLLAGGRLDLLPLSAVPELTLSVVGPSRSKLVGREAFGDRLTVGSVGG
ncbi:NACHT domain-containing protein [Streptomyces sp. NPDC020965]|uniref:NACHT domain-containing protein n=1 Tax=Streptomyces sp. NPDC020965 TaxID=3365105 RepID=UPI0037A51F36